MCERDNTREENEEEEEEGRVGGESERDRWKQLKILPSSRLRMLFCGQICWI